MLFDLDGTLVHSAPDLAVALNAMLQELGRSPHPEEQVANWVGHGMARLVKRGLTGKVDGEPAAELFEHALASFKRHYAANLAVRTRPYPGVVDVLDNLSRKNFLLGCVTNKIETFTRPLLDELGLSRYLRVVVGGDTVALRKPHPLPLAHACALAGVQPEQAVMVGDSAADIEAARAAGMPVIAVTYGYNQGRNLHELKPDALVDSLLQLPQYLRLSTT